MKLLFLGFASLFLASCSTIFGVPQSELDTANKNLAAVTIQITSVTRLTTSLVRAGTISPDQAREVQGGLQNALAAVETATQAVAASGDPSQATGALDIALTAVQLAIGLLSGFTGQDVSLLMENDFEPDFIGPRGGYSFKRRARGIALAT